MKLKIKNKKSSVTIFDSTMTELVTELVTMSQKNMSNLTLSITTIGDLLLHKKITNGDKPIEDVSLNIPIYQRPYKWTARNAIQLLDDIIEAMNSNKEKYRVGTLILHQQEEGRYDIVDGQRRTITFSLLLTALGEKNISFLRQTS